MHSWYDIRGLGERADEPCDGDPPRDWLSPLDPYEAVITCHVGYIMTTRMANDG